MSPTTTPAMAAVRIFFIVPAFLAGLAGGSFADSKIPAGLLAAEKNWNEANLHHDVTQLRAVLSPAFVQITESGAVVGREPALRALAAQPATGHAYTLSDRHFVVSGDIASVSEIYTETGTGRHGAYRAVLRLADIYRHSKQWRGLVGYAHLIALTHCPKRCRL